MTFKINNFQVCITRKSLMFFLCHQAGTWGNHLSLLANIFLALHHLALSDPSIIGPCEQFWPKEL